MVTRSPLGLSADTWGERTRGASSTRYATTALNDSVLHRERHGCRARYDTTP